MQFNYGLNAFIITANQITIITRGANAHAADKCIVWLVKVVF